MKLSKKTDYRDRIELLVKKRKTFCGVGTRKIKMRLNKLAKGNDIARMFRLALEAEDKSISAKRDLRKYGRYSRYADDYYEHKSASLLELINVCRDNQISFGKQSSGIEWPPHILYFYLPECEQISFHIDLSGIEGIPEYEKEWDTKEDSVLNKLEESIMINFPEICV